MTVRVGRIPYINCYPVYGAIDHGLVEIDAELVDGVPTALNRRMANGALDVSVISAVEYAERADRYLLLPDLAISCDGPVRSVALFARRPVAELGGERVLVSRSSMTSVRLLELLFEHVWRVAPEFVPADAEVTDVARFDDEPHAARLVIGDAALLLTAGGGPRRSAYPFVYDLGAEWKRWTGKPFVFAVWVARRGLEVATALAAHAALIASRDWGIAHLDLLADRAARATGIARESCRAYLAGLDYRLSLTHLDGLTDFFRRLERAGRVPAGTLAFLPAA